MSIILNVINYFWKLGFNEEAPDLYVKVYTGGHRLAIDLAAETFDFGGLEVRDPALEHFSQRNFVVVESLDRLLRRGCPPSGLLLEGGPRWDYTVVCGPGDTRLAVACRIWEDDYDEAVRALGSAPESPPMLGEDAPEVRHVLVYTSRLKAGIIEHRHAVFPRDRQSVGGSDPAEPLLRLFEQAGGRSGKASSAAQEGDFVIRDGVLVEYRGRQAHVVVPASVESLKNGVFWNTETLREITLPEGLRSLGGDTFYNCARLAHLVIPSSVEVVGDNPFAACPELALENRSPHFHLENGLLLDREGTRLVYCSIRRPGPSVEIPEGVISVGKHAFYACATLDRIVLPSTVKIVENNPFSDIARLRLENRSPHFIFLNGALYNKTMGTLFYYEQAREAATLEIPEGVRIIGRHSFYNCRNLRSLVIPSSVTIIGYNPFAGCSSLVIENRSPAYVCTGGALFNRNMTELIQYSISSPAEEFVVPGTVRKIGRSAFYQGRNLKRVRLPEGLEVIERSAFAGCQALREVNIPRSLSEIGEWAFSDCPRLQRLDLPAHTSVESHTFRGCPANSGLRSDSP
jgi:hypothetical protein